MKIITGNALYNGHCRDLELVSSLVRVRTLYCTCSWVVIYEGLLLLGRPILSGFIRKVKSKPSFFRGGGVPLVSEFYGVFVSWSVGKPPFSRDFPASSRVAWLHCTGRHHLRRYVIRGWKDCQKTRARSRSSTRLIYLVVCTQSSSLNCTFLQVRHRGKS